MKTVLFLVFLLVFSYSTCLAADPLEIAAVDCTSIITNFKVGEQYTVDLDQYPAPQIFHYSDGCIKYVWTQDNEGTNHDTVAVTIDNNGTVLAVNITEHTTKHTTEFSSLITSVYGKPHIQCGAAVGDTKTLKWQALQNNNSYWAIIHQQPDSTIVLISNDHPAPPNPDQHF